MISQPTVLPNDSDEELGLLAARISQDDHVQVLLCSLVCNLTWHTSCSLAHGFCGVPMCTASTERMTIKSSDILAPFSVTPQILIVYLRLCEASRTLFDKIWFCLDIEFVIRVSIIMCRFDSTIFE